MGGFLKKCSDIVDRIFKPITLVFLVIIIIACVLQVFSRYILNSSIPWTEELARYCFIWANMLGAAILVKKKGHAVIDFLVKNLHGLAKSIHLTLVNGIILAASGILIYQSFLLMPVVAQQISPATSIPMSYVYMSVPVGSVGIFIHALSALFSAWLPEKADTPAKPAEEGEVVI